MNCKLSIKIKKITLGLDFHFSYSFSSYFFSSFYAKYYIFFHPNNHDYLIRLSPCLCTDNIKKVKWKKSFECVSISSFGSLYIKNKWQFQYAAHLASLKIKVKNHFCWQHYENVHFSLNEIIFIAKITLSYELWIWAWIKKRRSFICLFSFLQHEKGLSLQFEILDDGNGQKAQPVLGDQKLTVMIVSFLWNILKAGG